MNKNLAQVLTLFLLFLLMGNVIAANNPAYGGFGGIANNLMSPLGFAADFIYSASVVIGSSFIFASSVKYVEHRRSPLLVPIGVPLFLLIAGIILVCMPLLSLLSDSAIRFSFFR